MAETEFLISVEYIDGRVEGYRCAWTSGPNEGVLNLGDVEGTEQTMTIVLANVRNYSKKRIR